MFIPAQDLVQVDCHGRDVTIVSALSYTKMLTHT